MAGSKTWNKLKSPSREYFPIWWSIAWRAAVVGALVGMVLGFLGGFTVGVMGYPELGGIAGAILGWIGSIPISIWALKAALSKEHGGYSVVLIKSA